MRRATALAALMVVLCAGCAGAESQTPAADPSPSAAATTGAGIPLTLQPPDGGDGVALVVEDAATPEDRQVGLMFRRRLAERAGMVFRYGEDRTGGFWMKNTLIPLSIAYFDAEGTVRVILDMEPCKADPCPSYEPEAVYRGALEVNQGLFDELGVEPGWRVVLPDDLPAPS